MTRILVIGAGLGGLTLAHALVRAGLDVRVYEADDGSGERAQGYRIGLAPPAMEALRGSLPQRLYELVEATSGSLAGPGLLFDEQLTLLSGDLPGPPEEARAFDRQVLRRILLGDLGRRVEHGKRLTGVAEEADGTVTARFADGTRATGEVLVGADGGNSVVRRYLAPEVGLVDADLCGAMGRTPLTGRFLELVPGRGTMVKGPGTTLMLGRMEFGREPSAAAAELAPGLDMPYRDSYVRWVLLVPPGHPAARESGRSDAREPVLELIDGWHPDLRDLVRGADMSAVGRSKVFDRPMPPWPAGRVTLLGDAAHLTLASGGNGANTALLDAVLLAELLAEAGRGERDLASALAEYQAELLERGNAAVEAGKRAQSRFVPSAVPSSVAGAGKEERPVGGTP
ncbi:FAD-dependent monooxygenase [Nonomuraea sp. 3-1Str]|uniref:FAD-dependent oxidoreductase n=1 Tax=Nonomuraea sp. 3-1Str TaxID=2929801 RepID=UPI00285F2E7F|nr:NAD(P)/FAD-dependent oxidoreductase [Nonomuraea sp. 3-1Str]MDR8413213.1 FAD-dependent monooxygenase [Nonomuraea sp. 3-1Str]